MDCFPPASDGKRCAAMGQSRAKAGKFDGCSELAWHVTYWSSSQGCFLVNLHLAGNAVATLCAYRGLGAANIAIRFGVAPE